MKIHLSQIRRSRLSGIRKTILMVMIYFFFISCEKEEFVVEQKEDFVFILYEGITFEEMEGVVEHLSANLPRMLFDLSLEGIDEPISIHIWKSEGEFLKQQKKKIDKAYPGSGGYVFNKKSIAVKLSGRTKETIEHELAHVLSLKLNQNIANNPRWLWETIATYESGELVSPKNHASYSKGNFPSLDYLNQPFNDGGRKIYDLGYMIGDYILIEFGREKYRNLIKSNGNISESLGITKIEFEMGWKEFAKLKYL